MWQADGEQQARVAALAEGFAEEMPVLWEELNRVHWQDFLSGSNYYWKPFQTLLKRLEARLGADGLRLAMPEYLVFPAAHSLPKDFDQGSEEQQLLAQFARAGAVKWVAGYGDAYAAELLGRRLRYLLEHAGDDPDLCRGDVSKVERRGRCFTLEAGGCIGLLNELTRLQHPEAEAFLVSLILGEWDGPVAIPATDGQPPRHTTRYAMFGHLLWQWAWSYVGHSILDRLCARGRLDYPGFLEVYRRFPPLIPFQEFRHGWGLPYAYGSAYGVVLCGHIRRLVCETLERWERAEIAKLGQFSRLNLLDGQWLLEACERVEQWGSAKPTPEQYAALSGIQGVAADEDAEDLVAKLRGFSEQALLVLLSRIEGGQHLILRALGFEDLGPVLGWLQGGDWYYRDSALFAAGRDAASEREGGVTDLEALLALLAPVDGGHLKKLVDTYHSGRLEPYKLMRLEAALGWNRKALETSIKRGKHSAIQAYGLLPLERGEAEVLQRYVYFKKIAKDSTKYGSERQANTRAAVQTGLAHLAQVAGYADLARLEWDMEAKIGGEGAPLGQRETIADWEVELNLDGLVPVLAIFKQGKPLKSVPAGLRKLERFLEFKDAQANIKNQVGRFRAALEAMMAGGEWLTAEDLRGMARLPVMSRLLQDLILHGEDGHFGWFDPDGPSLCGLDGGKTPLEGKACIAHPYHFFQAGVLPVWQQAVVRRRSVQPFKQVFRELYILTPAEEETGSYSNRFAGHSLRSPVASRLLQTRGWRITGDEDSVDVLKPFAKAGLKAEFTFPDAYRHLTFMADVVSDQIRFLGKDGQPVALKDVPPLIFSEVMRDADLAVSVAQLDERDRHVSTETYERRAELVSALLADLGLKGVRCEGHFAYVTGKRANYRVHLGSAAIHIEPGNYLCVVPDRSETKRDAFFLPFADADAKTSEVISKILLLANDHKIKDPSILAQIDRANPGAGGQA